LGYTSPQNFYIALEHYNKSDWLRLLTRGKRRRFYNHAGATFIRNHVSDEIWNTYYKFCFERNPFDRAISLYYWKTEEPRPDISEFLLSVPAKRLSNWNTYTIGNEIAVDFVGRYEHLSGDLLTIASRLGLPGGISLPNAKSRFRKNRAPYGSLLNDEVRSRIERVCRNEIEAFNYNRG